MKKNTLALLSAFVSMTALAQATIVVNLQADLLKNELGTAAPMGSLAFLVASTTDATFASLTLGASTAVGSLVAGTDDYIVGRVPVNSWADVGAFEAAFSSSGAGALNLSSIPGWNAGDPLALVWIPALTSSSATIPANARYGLFTRATATASDGSAAWITPNDGSSISLAFVTQDGGIFSPGPTASNTPASSRSTLTVVPEPATASLGLFGLAALCGFRRRRA